jgi:hypothetical protein
MMIITESSKKAFSPNKIPLFSNRLHQSMDNT